MEGTSTNRSPLLEMQNIGKGFPGVRALLGVDFDVHPGEIHALVGENGAGHYVKMVHNGIEYGDMELICEAYNLLKIGLGLSADQMQPVFAEWNKGELNSYLIEITRDILAFKDTDGQPLVDKILDTAGQKGTGKWTVINSQDLGIPITLIAEAVYARCVSALKDEPVKAARVGHHFVAAELVQPPSQAVR